MIRKLFCGSRLVYLATPPCVHSQLHESTEPIPRKTK
jgi:hypothetical protein